MGLVSLPPMELRRTYAEMVSLQSPQFFGVISLFLIFQWSAGKGRKGRKGGKPGDKKTPSTAADLDTDMDRCKIARFHNNITCILPYTYCCLTFASHRLACCWKGT